MERADCKHERPYRLRGLNWDGRPVVSGPLSWSDLLRKVRQWRAMGYDVRTFVAVWR
jgi:hypothetical protein